MSLAVYLKQFAQKLTTQADGQVAKLTKLTLKRNQSKLQATIASTAPGFNLLKQVTDILVQCCLSDTCEHRCKAQITTTIHKQLIVF